MPVTFCPATHIAKSAELTPITSAQLLKQVCPTQVDRIMQSSIGRCSGPTDALFKIVPNQNGFVDTVMIAYSRHYALVIRPDEVWLAIVSQFSFYVNANAELLRANFVSHQGKRKLEMSGAWPPDCALLSRQMGELMQKNIVDPTLREWILPKFSTTTTTDTTIGSMLLMATMRKFFDYTFDHECGIPRVTLEGERQDWEMLLHRLEKLKEYGLETIAWYHLLAPVISRFVKAFDKPKSPKNLQFWQTVAHWNPASMCGDHEYWSGWITAFSAFSPEGQWQGPELNTDRAQSRAPESLSSRDFWSSYCGLDYPGYPLINSDDIPAGYAEVNVTVNNNGTEYPCVILAGLVGMGFSSSRDRSVSETGKNDTVRPVLAWWMYSKLERRKDDMRVR